MFTSLRQLYESRLTEFGIMTEINKTRFKEHVLNIFPHAQELCDGKNAVLVFQQGMQQIVKQGMKCDHEQDALILAKAARILRDEIFHSTRFKFNGSFPPNRQHTSVPYTLKFLVTMIMREADLKD